MALVPFSYASPFTDQLQLAERLFTIDGNLLKIRQQPRDALRGDDDSEIAEHIEASHAAGGDAGGRPLPSDQSAKISVKRLRWGCEDDVRAAGCGSGDAGSGDDGGFRFWDVVLGSDIAALPYASAYGDLLRTIVSLVSSGDGGGEGEIAAPSSLRRAGDGQEGETNRYTREGARKMERRRRVVVLLAHKRRHLSEEAFFEDLTEKLGGEKSIREMGEGDIHADFRGTGIRLHVFEVEV